MNGDEIANWCVVQDGQCSALSHVPYRCVKLFTPGPMGTSFLVKDGAIIGSALTIWPDTRT